MAQKYLIGAALFILLSLSALAAPLPLLAYSPTSPPTAREASTASGSSSALPVSFSDDAGVTGTQQQSPKPSYLPNVLLVKVKPRIAPTILQARLKPFCSIAEIRPIFRGPPHPLKQQLGLDRWYKVTFKGRCDLASLMPKIQKAVAAYVEEITQDYYMEFFITPNDPMFSAQWSLHNIGQTGGLVDADIDAVEGWELTNYGQGDPSMIVAVIDSGLDVTHPEFTGKLWVNDDPPGDSDGDGNADDDRNGYADDLNGWNTDAWSGDIRDDEGHGTLVTGVLLAATNTVPPQGIAAVDWNAKLMVVKCSPPDRGCTTSAAADAIEYATDNGAKVIAMSMGTHTPSGLLASAARYGFSRDVVLVASAGNDGTSEYTSPAALDTVIGVGATDHSDEKWPFSNYNGQALNVEVVAPGVGIRSTAAMTPPGCALCDPSGYRTVDGTSLSAPLVAGFASVIRAKYPSLTSRQVYWHIYRATDDLGIPGMDTWYGYGRIRMGYEPWCGNAILDVGEECDDGNLIAGDGCAAYGCTVERCGNAILDVGEECDDGNADPTDRCPNDCRLSAVQCQPLDVMHVLDTSASYGSGSPGSGTGEIHVAKVAAQSFNAILQPSRDRAGLVHFGNGFTLHSSLVEPLTTDIAAVDAAIAPLANGGDQDDAMAIRIAQRELRENGRGKPVMLFQGDGLTGVNPEIQAAMAKAEGTEIYAVVAEPLDIVSGLRGVQTLTRVASGPDHLYGLPAYPSEREAIERTMRNIYLRLCRCGDGIRDAPFEQCDDGNTVSGDGCTACAIDPMCGNGIVEGWEDCDDGKHCADGRSCRSDADCGGAAGSCAQRDTDSCTNACLRNWCGDGILNQGAEQCDDGMQCPPGVRDTFADPTRCDRDYECEGRQPGDPPGSWCRPRSGDGCSNSCFTEQRVCGNGILEPGEQCDDGNRIDGDGCTARCSAECHDTDSGLAIAKRGAAVASGNRVQDRCPSDISVIEQYCGPKCDALGDTVVSPADRTVGLRSMEISCWQYNFQTCAPTDQLRMGACVGPNGYTEPLQCSRSCGNGVLEVGEECDDGNTANMDGCSALCASTYCGNGMVDYGEQCDDGQTCDYGQQCSTDSDCPGWNPGTPEGMLCKQRNGDRCKNDCTRNVCGDGALFYYYQTEQCDDGNLAAGDGCSPICQLEPCGAPSACAQCPAAVREDGNIFSWYCDAPSSTTCGGTCR